MGGIIRLTNTEGSVAYPPLPYRIKDVGRAIQLMREHPFAHLLTAHGGPRATRVPFVADVEGGRPIRLRSHLDALNPQALNLDGAEVLAVFSGPAAYVSPHWRADKTKGGTYDYEEVQVRGTARIVREVGFFKQLIDDLSALIEPQHAEIGDYPIWRTSMAPKGHIERQVTMVTPFAMAIDAIETTAKLHQNFPDADRRSVAAHLSRSRRQDMRAIAARILEEMDRSTQTTS